MDLPSLCGSARVCYFGGRRYLVRPLSLDARGSLLAWLDDVLEGWADRRHPPSMADPESQGALDSETGRALLVALALREHGLGFADAALLASEMSDAEWAWLKVVAFGRRRTLRPGEGGSDIAEFWFGPMACRLMERYPGLTPDHIRMITLDQLDCLASGGLEMEQPRETMAEIAEEDPRAILERLRAEHPEFAARLDEQIGAKNGEVG